MICLLMFQVGLLDIGVCLMDFHKFQGLRILILLWYVWFSVVVYIFSQMLKAEIADFLPFLHRVTGLPGSPK